MKLNFRPAYKGDGLFSLSKTALITRVVAAWEGGTGVALSKCIMNDTIFPLNEAQPSAKSAQRRQTATPWHAVEPSLVTRLLGVNPTVGLGAAEVATRRLSYGPNNEEGIESQRITRMLVLLFFSIAIGFVLTAAILNGLSRDNIEAFSLLTVIVIGSIVGFAYVLKSARALDTMHNAAEAYARVIREGKQMKVEAEQLVPGDIVILEAGDSVPADARLIQAAQLEVKETALTGKDTVVEKGTSPTSQDAPLDERQSMVYFGTALNSGSGVAVVVATGSNTALGKIADCAN